MKIYAIVLAAMILPPGIGFFIAWAEGGHRDAAACEDRYRNYKRLRQIEDDERWCRDESREHADVSFEGCMDRRAKEWPLP